jgi:hypothetical protein
MKAVVCVPPAGLAIRTVPCRPDFGKAVAADEDPELDALAVPPGVNGLLLIDTPLG